MELKLCYYSYQEHAVKYYWVEITYVKYKLYTKIVSLFLNDFTVRLVYCKYSKGSSKRVFNQNKPLRKYKSLQKKGFNKGQRKSVVENAIFD